MPRSVYVLAFGIFAMVTSEFAVAGLMPQMARGLGATVPQIGYLITAFAAAMALGGPVMTVALSRLRPRDALMTLFAVFLAGNVLAAAAPSYPVMVVARIITGVASQAFFGVTVSLAVRLARPEVRGRAIAVVMNGLMVGTLLGLPLSTMIGERFGWRAAFWAVGALTLVAAPATLRGVPRLTRADGGGGAEGADLRGQLAVFRDVRLLSAFLTSTLIIGATFSAFSYLNPILTGLAGFATGAVPYLLVAYGAATVIGNHVVGRLADRHTIAVLVTGLTLNAVFLAGFALLAHVSVAAVAFMLGVGLVGVTMNPAMATRVQRAGNAGPLVNTVHSSFITLGVMVGSSVGGLAVDAYGLRAPLWLGAALAVLGLLTLLPERGRSRTAATEPGTAKESVPSA
ncbi:MFS transporter [Nonomuraea roseoviolacea]|uniref:MFS family arabinose efflux permease n=1 Tax=Nonomuraea roseoviolacea subsp. carminata TaxID=160689 RepID=A0ABT1K0A0_9ACTN|nr:MFS transporter [Nonomuraea roseoviolacea]MCP2347432.1 putative MFS family arabinose efflux permease [Nonomuraea roseoviolacea subsp. carminata]